MESARQVATAQAQLASAQKRLAALQSINALLRARDAVYRAATALDNRNFGTADKYVATVVADLNTVDPNAAGMDSKGFAAAKEEAAGLNISVARNLSAQRLRLMQLAKAIDAIVPQNASSSITY